MNNIYIPLISTVSNSFNDFTLDIAVNKFNTSKVLFITSILAAIGQLIGVCILGIEITLNAIPLILLYGAFILCGYICYVKSLTKLPVGLTALIESGNMFVILIIDMILGYLNITPLFIVLFTIFVIAIFIFSYETNKIKDEIKLKKVNLNGIFILLTSMFFYVCVPYIIKAAGNLGANGVTIGFGYYILCIPYFYIQSRKHKAEKTKKSNKEFITLCVLIGIFQTIYIIANIISYINITPIMIVIIEQTRAFLLFILSAIFGTDKINIKKVIAMVIGIGAIIGISLS